MLYDLGTKLYTCTKCGLTLSYQELMEARRRAEGQRPDRGEKRREYLEWWLSKKK